MAKGIRSTKTAQDVYWQVVWHTAVADVPGLEIQIERLLKTEFPVAG